MRTPSPSDQKGGKQASWTILARPLCHSTTDLGCASEVGRIRATPDDTADTNQEDFALSEASCAIVRILQTFPRIRLPEGLHTDPTGQERQLLTVLVTSAEGCKVVLD